MYLGAPAAPPSAKAHMRAMPVTRLLAGGMDYADAVQLHEHAQAGIGWDVAAERLGELNMARAGGAVDGGHRLTAQTWFLLASACFRFGQVLLDDHDPRKSELYLRMLASFRLGADLMEPPAEHVEVPWRDGVLSGWLIRAPRASVHPFVIALGGVDAWREEYEPGARCLRERGISTLLVDGPGQGESRVLSGLHLDEDVVVALGRFVDLALADDRCSGQVGVWGNSAGGWLAGHLAAADPRIAACCINGGTDRPTEILDRYPRYIGKLQLLTGRADPAQAREVLDALTLDSAVLERLRCPLHVVHGTPDTIFLAASARRIHAGAASEDKTLSEFPDGDHCIANRSHERNTLIADWLGARLRAGSLV
jgi:alpha-beta hydrolase superfamily lysophospholipase